MRSRRGRSARHSTSAWTVTRRSGSFLQTEVPLRRWAEPAELTAAALLLTDPQSSYLTGVILPVDGGWTAH